jgi:demethoxyubiquinone hydroxylase (CLK1/Coq7/Cat5 family)
MLGTIAAVEQFVDVHYLEQIECLKEDLSKAGPERLSQSACRSDNQCGLQAGTPQHVFGEHPDLLAMLEAFRHDELEHRDDALDKLGATRPGFMFRLWCSLVGQGSAMAVRLAKWV